MVDPKNTKIDTQVNEPKKLKAELDKPPYLLLYPCRGRILTGLGMFTGVLILIFLLSDPV